jgi:hypothetical protein
MVFADDSRRQCLDPSYAVYIQRYTNFAIVSRKLFTAVRSLFLRSRAWLEDVPTSSVPCGTVGIDERIGLWRAVKRVMFSTDIVSSS